MKQIELKVEIPKGSDLNSEVKFPVDKLPAWLQHVVNNYSQIYNTPPEIWAIAFLCGIASASGKRFRLNTGNYSNYPQLWFMIVGTSGTGKSEPLAVAYRPLEKINGERFEKYLLEYEKWEKKGKSGAPPRWHQTLINDTTPEALFSVLGHATNGLTLYRDELSGWFSDIGRYNKSGEVGHYISIYNNKSITINRKLDKPIMIPEPLFNIAGTIQPSILKDVLSHNNAEESGFAQRFLYMYPHFPVRKYQHIDPGKGEIEYYYKFINVLCSFPEETRDLRLSEEAENQYESFFNELEIEREKSDDYWSSVFSKAQIQVLRLALTVKISRYGEVEGTKFDYVESKDMECAISMMRYFIQSLRNLRECMPNMKNSEIIKEIIRSNPEAILTDIAKALGVSKQYVSKIGKGIKVDKLTVDSSENPLPKPRNENLSVNRKKDAI
jgi:hypothetical protein